MAWDEVSWVIFSILDFNKKAVGTHLKDFTWEMRRLGLGFVNDHRCWVEKGLVGEVLLAYMVLLCKLGKGFPSWWTS